MPAPRKLPPIEAIVALSAEGLTYAQIAERYGVTKYAVAIAMQRTGHVAQKPVVPLDERFWAKVNKRGPVSDGRPDLGPCWLWTASTDDSGYGQFAISAGKVVKAHIVAYKLTNGRVPRGIVLDHLCRVLSCVNPGHLDPVTGRVNILRGLSTAARNAIAIDCIHGHPFSGDNLYEYRGHRMCKTCMRARKKTAAYRERDNARRRKPRPAA